MLLLGTKSDGQGAGQCTGLNAHPCHKFWQGWVLSSRVLHLLSALPKLSRIQALDGLS